jgi:hypothetical protein
MQLLLLLLLRVLLSACSNCLESKGQQLASATDTYRIARVENVAVACSQASQALQAHVQSQRRAALQHINDFVLADSAGIHRLNAVQIAAQVRSCSFSQRQKSLSYT